MDKCRPNIFEFNDFRQFLEAYRVARKAYDQKFTHQFICAQLGLPNTRGFFNNIVKGRRTLTDSNVERFIKLFELPEDEGLFFRVLVKYNQADNGHEKDMGVAILHSLAST
jgi:uncharacterized protein (TIGR02147 family)